MPAHTHAEPVARVRNHFEFSIEAPMKTVAPLFGPEGERVWAGDDWNPCFLFPTPARDTEGAVFTVSGNHSTSTWVNTVFDLDGGHMQYVYFIPNALVTHVDVRLSASDKDRTHVGVTYERTALDPKSNEHVRQMGADDARSGPEWKQSIDDYFEKGASRK